MVAKGQEHCEIQVWDSFILKCRPKTPMHFKAYTKLVPNSEVWDTLSPKQLCPGLASEGHGVFYTSKSETRVAYALKSGTFWSTL